MTENTYLVQIGKRRGNQQADVPSESVSTVIEDYPRQVLAEVTENQRQDLIRQGYRVEDLSSKRKIRVGTMAIDPTHPEERLAAISPTEEESVRETEYNFVQFIGPVKAEWLEALTAENLKPLAYYHDFTYLVYGKPEDVERLGNRPFVRATMPYGSGMKLDPASMKLELEEGEEQEFWILIFTPGGKIDQVFNQLFSLGVKFAEEREEIGFYLKVKALIPTNILPNVKKLPEVYRIEKFYPRADADEVADQIVAGNYNGADEVEPPLIPGEHPYLNWMEELGVDGTGVTIGVVELSTSIDEDHPAFTGRITPVTAKARGYHATMVAGQAAANYQAETDANDFIYCLGISPEANLLNQNVQDGTASDTCRVTVTTAGPNGESGTVQNNSWGYLNLNGDYGSHEETYDQLVRDADSTRLGNQELVICFAAGNEGFSGTISPARAKNIITVGNFENYRPTDLPGCGENDADDINERYRETCAISGTGPSSVGNCSDGRVKPDLVAPGQWTASANSSVDGKPPGHSRYISAHCVYGGGTSAASPKVAGACALLIQWWRNRHTVGDVERTPSPALVKAMLINGAVDTGEGGPIPNEEQGWGRINLHNVFLNLNNDAADHSVLPAIYVDQEILLLPDSELDSEKVEFDLNPIDSDQPLKITLVWTDCPGNDGDGTAVTRALKNALGLKVTRETDTGIDNWFGNNFDARGWSQTDGHQDAIQTVHDGIVNNVQNVFIEDPDGTYHVEISPESIVENCLNPRSSGIPPAQQDFALVIQNGRLTATTPMDVMLCIDRTGSMRGEPIASAKAAAMQFMDLIPIDNNHQAGLVSYATPSSYPSIPPCDPDVSISDRATTDVDLTLVTDTLRDDLTEPTGPIGSIVARDYTSIGAGLKMASERIVANGLPLHRKTIILLTDGQENRSPCVSDILPLLQKEYTVHVIAYGNPINEEIVGQISSSTHAELRENLDPYGDELATFYHQILARETDQDLVDSETDEFASGETKPKVKRFPIVNSDSKATFIVGWKKPDLSFDVELITPSGKTITPTQAQRYVKRSTHVIYTLKRSSLHPSDWEGEWSVKISRESGTAAETITTSALVRSSLRFKFDWDKFRYFTKDLLRLQAKIIDQLYALQPGVKLTTQITAPVKGYGSFLADLTKKGLPKVVGDAPEETTTPLSKAEWQALYAKTEAIVETNLEVGGEENLEETKAPIVGIEPMPTPHTVKLKQRFRPDKDGIYTYKFKAEGHTASGARFTRMRTVSKYIGAKADLKKSGVVFQPLNLLRPKILKLIFTPKDVNGNLVGSGHANALKIEVEHGILKGVEDRLDGSYLIELEATEQLEKMKTTVIIDGVSIPVVVPASWIASQTIAIISTVIAAIIACLSLVQT